MTIDKVLLLSTAAGMGGTERVVLLLAQELTSRGIPVQTVFPAVASAEATRSWFEAEGVPAQTAGALREVHKRRSWADVFALRRFVRSTKAAVVNVHYGVNHISLKDVLAIRLAGKRCVVSVHHAVPWADERTRKNTRLGASLAHAVIVTTEVMRQQLLDAGIAGSKIQVIANGSPPPRNPLSREQARACLGVPPDAYVVATLARLVPEKGIDDLLSAAGTTQCEDLRLIVAGDGPDRRALEISGQKKLEGRVTFLGRIPDPDVLYAATDVFALPSREEGFGLVFVEAAFHGTPSIAARVGGVPAVIKDGVTGLLVEPGDIAGLGRAIKRLAVEPQFRMQLGAAAKERALGEFTAEVMVERYLRVLTSLKPSSPRSPAI